ncbi:odorant receptor 94b-like [Drosophila innubila]|uniref:odorant receptor 94b-like n=1 Tax=Drosophila innubila TaxID=198719 RepID=UPI00148DB882|nr:odorant receptor 94b-like [Drosophila innubila]
MDKLLRASQRILPSNAAEGRLGSIELNLWLAQLVGLPLLGLKKESRLQKIVITLFGAIVLFSLFWYVIFELYDLYLNWQDLDIMTQNLVLSLTHAAYWLKVFNTCYHYGSLKEIVHKLSVITRVCVLSKKQTKTFHKAEMESKLVMLMYFHLVLLPGVMGLVWVLIFPDDLAGIRFPYRVKIPDILPPIVQYFYMGMSVALLALAITTIDYLNVLLMNHICMHLKVLNLAFDELHVTPDRKLKVEPYDWLLSIVKYHCELIVLRQHVERIYRLPVMLQFVSSVVIVAMTAFQVIVGDGSKSSVIMDLLLSCVLCQLFLYCWFGNEVYEQSKTLSTSGFGCSWHEFDKKFRKTLLIFMINADRPFLFTAGGFMGLTLPSFTFIISKSYSIVAVLRQMYSRT